MGSIKFAEDLEIDPQAYELRRGGRAVRLERIPMEILLFLVERRPGLVTREEIAERIWGKGVFVDTDNSINGAIRKIRQALNDAPEDSRVIRTVTGKGYRFIATPVGEAAVSQATASPSSSATAPAEQPPGAVPLPVAPGVTSGGRTWRLLLVALVVVGLAMATYFRRSLFSSAPASEGRLMLAVLPFDNLTGDPGQDYFSEGFTEEMITRLGSLEPRRLGVIARTSAMFYKKTPAPLDRLANELGVQYVLEGSIRRDSRRVRIDAQLIQLKDQSHLWARQFDREATDVLQIQTEIAQAIADQIELTLGESRAPRQPPPALSAGAYEAYEHYLKGRYFWNKRTAEGFRRAIESFQQAIAANPGEARAYAGLADAYMLTATYGLAPEKEVIPKARAAALKALEIDEDLAAALTSLALVNELFDLDWRTAEDRFRRAIELEPNYATAHHWYAECLAYEGRFEESLAQIAIARKLDPRSLIMAVDHAYILFYTRRYDRSIEEFRAALAVDPTFGRAIGGIIGVYWHQGRIDEAREETERWMRVDHGPWPLAAAAIVHGHSGEPEKARQALRKLEDLGTSLRQDPLGWRWLAYIGMGRKEEAFAFMQQACDKSPWKLISVKVDPMYDSLRDDPRFEQMIRCVHLQPG